MMNTQMEPTMGDHDISLIRRGFEDLEFNSEKLKLELFESQQQSLR